MEGNFYISDIVIDRKLQSKYGLAYSQCRPQASAYGQCIEQAQINRELKRNYCARQREELRQCVNSKLKLTTMPWTIAYVQRRTLRGYSSLDISRAFAARAQKKRCNDVGPGESSSGSGSSVRRRERSCRPEQSSAQDRRDAARVFPETLPSGRPAQRNTISQRIFMARASSREEAEREAIQRLSDGEYEAAARRAKHGRNVVDRRFYSHVSHNYEDIQDTDPYAAIFGESGGTQRLRTSAWQRQFEEENAGVELPYERTNIMSRIAPNWFVRYFVNLRDRGGADSAKGVILMGVVLIVFVVCALTTLYTPSSKAKPIEEVK